MIKYISVTWKAASKCAMACFYHTCLTESPTQGSCPINTELVEVQTSWGMYGWMNAWMHRWWDHACMSIGVEKLVNSPWLMDTIPTLLLLITTRYYIEYNYFCIKQQSHSTVSETQWCLINRWRMHGWVGGCMDRQLRRDKQSQALSMFRCRSCPGMEGAQYKSPY